jgi:putative serine protease PepD
MNPFLKTVIAPVAALLAAGVVGGLASIAAWEAIDTEPAAAPAAQRATTAEPAASSQSQSSIASVVESVLPSVVEVKIEGTGDANPFPGIPAPTVQGLGSGWLFDDSGHVVTNQHVVDGAEKVTVAFQDGTEVSARVVGSDASTDVAVLELEDVPDSATPLELGSTSALELGDALVAIGSPLGLQGTVTAGIVSGLGRDIEAPDGFTIDGAVQTDAALNHGNSGGPLLDLDGRVVGMNAQIASDTGANSGIGYAIPVETVRSIAQQLISSGKVEHAYLGVSIEDADGDTGARIAEVRPETPAAEAGLQVGDVVTEVDGESIESGDELRLAVEAHKPGDSLELTVQRDGDTKTVTVELGSRPASAA